MLRTTEACPCPIKEVGPSMAGSCGSTLFLFMSILESYINGRCDLADPCNRVQSREELDQVYDFVVVGGGTAGAVVAARLSENPEWKVLLIEAGGDEPTASSVPAFINNYWHSNETDWLYYTEPQESACLKDKGKCRWPRGKMLGGCSSVNGMVYTRGSPEDYDDWEANGAIGWAWADVFPYFLKSEDNKEIGKEFSSKYHSTGGPLPVQRFRWVPKFGLDAISAAAELGFSTTNDLNGQNKTGFTRIQALNDNGSRYSTARAFLRPVSKRKNLHVLLHALVSRVIVDSEDKRVTAVEYIKGGQTRRVCVQKEAIISGGIVNSPQILQLSGIGPKKLLKKFDIPIIHELPGVGRNLHNHVGIQISFTLTKELETNVLDWTTAMDFLLKREGPLTSTSLGQITGIISSKHAPADGKHPDLQIFFGGYDATCSNGEVYGVSNNTINRKRPVTISAINVQPRSRGFIAIRSTDPAEAPAIQPNYFMDKRDLDIVVDGAKVAFRIANTTIMREKYGMVLTEGFDAECDGLEQHTDDYFRCLAIIHTAPENHQAGSCKMGPNTDPTAVVDMQLKVHGVRGLRVIDASAMPKVPSGNIGAAVIMLAERGADFIKSDY